MPESDFTNEDNFMKIRAAASLVAATAKAEKSTTDEDIREIADLVGVVNPARQKYSAKEKNHILWVDDRKLHTNLPTGYRKKYIFSYL